MSVKIPLSPRRSRNQDNARQRDPEADTCYVCGKAVKQRRFWIWVHDGGDTAVLESEGEERNANGREAADLGWHLIGPDCMRRYPDLIPYVKEH